jgi:hypothetical protein
MVYAEMNFGRYRGQPPANVPAAYLRWCLAECNCLDDWLRRCIIAESTRRGIRPDGSPMGREAPVRAPAGGALIDLPGLIRTCYREMALRFHPDRGGSHEAMVAISIAHDRLKELAGSTDAGANHIDGLRRLAPPRQRSPVAARGQGAHRIRSVGPALGCVQGGDKCVGQRHAPGIPGSGQRRAPGERPWGHRPAHRVPGVP